MDGAWRTPARHPWEGADTGWMELDADGRHPVAGCRGAAAARRAGLRARLRDVRRGARRCSTRSSSRRSRWRTSTPTCSSTAWGWPTRRATSSARRRSRDEDAGDRPHGRAEPRRAAAVPARDRAGAAADGGAGDLAGEADRARRPDREAADDRGQPAARRVDREGLPRARPDVPRPDPGGIARPDPGGGEVRLPQGLQVLDVRDVVDPPGRHAGDRRQGAHDPDPGAHGREAEQGDPHRASAGAAAGPRAAAGRDRHRAAHERSSRCARSSAWRSCRSRSSGRSARRTTRSSATSSRTSRPRARTRWRR